jgi:hypothetical protein
MAAHSTMKILAKLQEKVLAPKDERPAVSGNVSEPTLTPDMAEVLANILGPDAKKEFTPMD